ncbi:MAG: hypothetical protein HYX69_15640 [Planctomycetia bacterium]|nr:hypothetical protein [Planctomycetia bacterium]
MSKANLFAATLALFLLATVSVAADNAAGADKSKAANAATVSPQSVVYDAASAFEFLKSLTGEWERSGDEHDHGGKSQSVAFRETAAGSAVMETIFAGEPMEMISMYHMDGDKLLLTHYCALQNAPVMRFEKSDRPGEIKFVFHGGTNFDPQVDAHVHEGVMRIKDANTLESSFVGYTGGKPDQRPHGVLKRKPAKATK